MRISDWSSDVCSSDLAVRRPAAARGAGGDRLPAAADGAIVRGGAGDGGGAGRGIARRKAARHRGVGAWRDRKSVVSGKSVSVRVDLGGRRIIKKKNDKLKDI